MGSYLLIGLIAAVSTYLATPVVTRLATRMGWMYEPNDRTVHVRPMPAIGGMAMFVGFIVALAVARLWNNFDPVFARNSEPQGVVIAAVIMLLTGLIDDIHPISAPAKVTGTVLAGMSLVWFGVTMYYFRVPWVGVLFPSDEYLPLLTVVWLLGLTQAINLIDGLDGLAAGIVAIAAGTFFLYAQRLGDLRLLNEPNIGPLIAIIACGLCLGFLPHNFNPAKIFMGDGGALLLGSLMAVSTSVVGGRADQSQQYNAQTFFFLAPLALPLIILAVPLLDVAFAILRRIRHRQAVDLPDKGHLHHRLMNLGHGHRRSVLILWAWTLLLSAFVLYPVLTNQNPTYVPFGVIAIGIALFTVLHPSVRRRRAESV